MLACVTEVAYDTLMILIYVNSAVLEHTARMDYCAMLKSKMHGKLLVGGAYSTTKVSQCAINEWDAFFSLKQKSQHSSTPGYTPRWRCITDLNYVSNLPGSG